MRKLGFVLFLCAGLAGTSWADLIGDEKVIDTTPLGMTPEVWAQVRQEQGEALVGAGPVVQRCVNGLVLGRFPCRNVDMLAFVPKEALGVLTPVTRPDVTVILNDIWGWTDLETGREFALVGGVDRTTFVEITNPLEPRVLGWLTSHQKMADGAPMRSIWRGIKVFGDHAFIVADAQNQHGMQVFDLHQLLNVQNPPVDFAETAHLPFGSAHNIVMNEETGYAYAVGTSRNAAVGDCQGGLLMINVLDPRNPKRAGCFPDDGYTHDAQCVVYRGPDVEHQGKEICFAYNTDTVTIVDVTNKATPIQISRTGYNGSRYTHQGWFTDETQRLIAVNDELDESRFGGQTRTYVFDVSDLDAPRTVGVYHASTTAIDHNLFAIPNPFGGDPIVIQSNYRAGVRILNTAGIAQGRMQEAAFFDMIPEFSLSTETTFAGVWMTYPFFPSGNLVATDLGNGLYILRPDYAAIRRLRAVGR